MKAVDIVSIAALLGWYHDALVADHHASEYRNGWRDLELVCLALGLPHGDTTWTRDDVHVFSCGAYADTHVLATGTLDGALEDAASVLEGIAPGAFVSADTLEDLVSDAREELGEDASEEDIHDLATQDLTFTESGYLPSWEWNVITVDSLVSLCRAMGLT